VDVAIEAAGVEAIVLREPGARLMESQLREINDFMGPQRPDSISRKLLIRAVVEAPQLFDYSKVID
jgi:hypothetical protein